MRGSIVTAPLKEIMTVYLLHFDSKVSEHAQHYIGYSTPANLKRRIKHHKDGSGARLTQVCNDRGITYEVVRVWQDGDLELERRLKRCKKARRFCPLCNPKAMQNMTVEKLQRVDNKMYYKRYQRQAPQRNPKHGTFLLPAGYRDIGGQLSSDNSILVQCRTANHKRREFDNSLFVARATDIITICDECKYVYHTDMSD